MKLHSKEWLCGETVDYTKLDSVETCSGTATGTCITQSLVLTQYFNDDCVSFYFVMTASRDSSNASNTVLQSKDAEFFPHDTLIFHTNQHLCENCRFRVRDSHREKD